MDFIYLLRVLLKRKWIIIGAGILAAFIAWYFGGFGLVFALCFVFFYSHRRIWALVEEKASGVFEVTLGGNTNRNHFGFGDKFEKVVADLQEQS